MKYPAYPDYSESPYDFIGVVPSHWLLRRLKFNVSKVGSGVTPKGGAESYEIEGIPFLRSQNIHFEGLKLDDLVYISAETHELMSNSQVAPGDVLINITGASIGRCSCFDDSIGEANVNQHVCIIRTEQLLKPRYLYYLLRSGVGQQQILLEQSGSGREGLNFESLNNFVIPCVPADEQEKIVDFLNWKTGQIDALIAKKMELVEKLKEKRIAVMTQAVTKGLDPSAPMRESGIEWLGKVPRRWIVKRLRFACKSIEQGWSPQCDNQPADDDCWGVMKVGCVNGDVFDELENKALPLELEPQQQYELRPKDILISRANTRELLGSAALVPNGVRPRLLLCDKLYRVTASQEVDEEFLTYYLRTPAARFQYEREATGASSSMKNIGQDTIRNLVTPLPPLEEQKMITEEIGERVLLVDNQLRTTEAALARLTEYRIALITAATTGKIDVREVWIPAQVQP